MPFTARDLIEGRQNPVCVGPDDLVQTALERMVENDYSQLPVVDEHDKPKALISADSILRGLANFGVTVERLRVRDVMEKSQIYSFDEDIFDLLDSLNDYPAVLLTDGEGHLVGIVTNWDASEYFRRRAENMMLVEDIEAYLKEHIIAASRTAHSAEEVEAALQTAIDEVSNAQTFSSAKDGITKYISRVPGTAPKFNSQIFEEVCTELYRGPKALKDLTLNQLTALLLHKSHWSNYGIHFSIDDQAIRKMLKNIQEIRNTLAHFRDELTPAQREALRFCARWFELNPPVNPEAASEVVTEPLQDDLPDLLPIEEEIGDDESRYARLAVYLQNLRDNRVQITFEAIEAIIGGPLPPSARQHRAWWANDTVSHVQSQLWLEAGWRVVSMNLTDGFITFARAKERETAYIEFFSQLLSELRSNADFPIRGLSPIGASWHTVGWYMNQNGGATAALNFAFTQRRKFRVELYIDIGDRDRNKEIFRFVQGELLASGDFEIITLTQGKAPEIMVTNFTGRAGYPSLGEIHFERLDTKRASRIGIYKMGAITDSRDILDPLCHDAVSTMIAFHHVLAPIMAKCDLIYRG